MRIAIAVFALLLSGCAHSPFMEPIHTAEVSFPCGPNDCGKQATWDYPDDIALRQK